MTSEEWFAAGFMVVMGIVGIACFRDARFCGRYSSERLRMNLLGLLSWALALAMGAWKF